MSTGMATPRAHYEADTHTPEPIDENILSADHTKDRLNKLLKEVFLVVHATPPELHMEIEQDLIKLHEDKKKLQQMVKENYVLKHDLDDLDEKIRMLIKNKLSLEEVTTSVSHLLGDQQEQMATLGHEQRELYGALLYQLQQKPEHLAKLTRCLANTRDIDNYLRVVVLTLYGDQYDSHEERLLLSMFQMVLQEEFNNGELETFMRSNTAITSMLSMYARRPGSLNAVKDVLGHLLEEIVAADRMSLEINPHKVYMDMINEYETATGSVSPLSKEVTPEEAAQNRDVQRICAERTQIILQYTDRFLVAIYDNLDLMLYGVRWICRQLDKMARRKFVQASEAQIFSIVGGFFFLRFINPIIVTPDGNSIITARPNKITRRNLTLIAKVIQNLSNGVLFGDKEEWMNSINPFLADKREFMDDLFRRLTDVEDLEDVLSSDATLLAQSLNLTETKRISITYNELAQVHALLDRNLRKVVTDPEDSVVRTLDLLGAPLEEVPRACNPSLIIELEASTRLDEKLGFRRNLAENEWDGHGQHDGGENSEEMQRRDVKNTLTSVIQQIRIMDQIPVHWGLTELLDYYKDLAVKKEDFILAQNIKNAQRKMEELFQTLGGERTGKKLVHFHLELIQELHDAHVSMFQSKEKIKRNIDRLERALESIEQQKETLKVTLDYYKQYLNNARGEVLAGNARQATRQQSSRRFFGRKRPDNEVRFTYKQLVDMKVIVRSDIAEAAAKHVVFTIARNEEVPGRFDISAAIKGVVATTASVFLDELLEDQSRHVNEVDMEQLVLNVNMLIHLLNTHFVRTK